MGLISSIVEMTGEKVSPEIAEQRIAICNGCVRLNPATRICVLCTCEMDEKVKYEYLIKGIRKTLVTCPEKKW